MHKGRKDNKNNPGEARVYCQPKGEYVSLQPTFRSSLLRCCRRRCRWTLIFHRFCVHEGWRGLQESIYLCVYLLSLAWAQARQQVCWEAREAAGST